MIDDFSKTHEFMRPLVEQWLRKIELARKEKKPFQEIGDQCDAFFSQSSGFMWKDAFKNKYLGKSIATPKFQITINKAFELVAVFGPYLFWKYPNRFIQNYDPLELMPECFGDPEDPYVQQIFQQAMQETAMDAAKAKTRNALMEKYLNYSQREQPGGGLAIEAELAITDALVRGRGLLWVEDYSFPGSDHRLTGCFHDDVDNFFVDPDCKDPCLNTAKWIARRHVTPDWELEDKFNLPRGVLKKKGQFESQDSEATNVGGDAKMHRENGQSNDLIVWYEIWSKCGVGSRMNYLGDKEFPRMGEALHDAFDDAVGDYAYLCIAPSVPWPLNAPSGLVRKLYRNEEISKLFRWRAANYGAEFPCYLDGRWPVAILDFYRKSGWAWPIAPLAPALGELTALNVLMSALVEQGYENRKNVIAVLESAKQYVNDALNGTDNPAIVTLKDTAHQDIKAVIQYLNRPDMNKDILLAIEYLFNLFDKRTGLTEIHYAMNVGGAASRSARDVAVKEEKASIRPEKMSQDVGRWMSDAAQLEKFLAGWTVSGDSLVPLLGRPGAYLWEQYISMEDPEVFVREMQATVEASDIRRPNKERLASNMQQMLQFILPLYQQYAQETGNTEPLNNFLQTFGESIEQDLSGWQLGPWQPQVDPAMQQAQQEMMELEKAKLEGDVMKGQADVQKSQIEMEKTRMEAMLAMNQVEIEAKAKQQEFDFDRMKHVMDMIQDKEKFGQEMIQDRTKFIQEMMQKRAEARLKFQQQQQDAQVKGEAMKEQAKIKTDSAKEQAKIKAQEAKKKPSTNGSKA